jgi:serine protease Do
LYKQNLKEISMKKVICIVLIAFVTSATTYLVGNKIFNKNYFTSNDSGNIPNLKMASYTPSPDGAYVNLENAAELSSKAVVHIKTETKSRIVQGQNPFGGDIFDQLFGNRGGGQMFQQPPQNSSGSGVIISADGYIVTNNHVVDNADEVTVILNNKRSLKAKVVGKDASTDLAVLKVNESGLPYLSYGNSDEVRLGQWVLAVGYPLALETTVTAGIVSAKYRNIGINQSKSGSNTAIESFIQTDAAVNPGNSGGALVNARGELIGINSAIASPTGSYAGYSFAIPSNIVKKIVEDMIKFGNVQRGYMGISYVDNKMASPEEIASLGLDKIDGIYIRSVEKGSSAESAGLKIGDFITKIGNKTVITGPEMQEQIAQYRPGDIISVTYKRNGKESSTNVKLKNKLGNTDIVKNDVANDLGISFRELSKQEGQRLNIEGGLYITDIQPSGLIAKQTRMRKSFIITQVNDNEVKTQKEFDKMISSGDDEFQIGGIYPNTQGVYYYMIKTE